MDTATIIAIAALIVAIVTAYFAYVPIRGRIRRRRQPAPVIKRGPGPYDVFVSYADADTAWATAFAEKLRRYPRPSPPGRKRFIPVLIEDVSLPPCAQIRQPPDLRNVTDLDHQVTRLAELIHP